MGQLLVLLGLPDAFKKAVWKERHRSVSIKTLTFDIYSSVVIGWRPSQVKYFRRTDAYFLQPLLLSMTDEKERRERSTTRSLHSAVSPEKKLSATTP